MKDIIEKAWENRELLKDPQTVKAIEELIEQLDKGKIRVAEPKADGGWQVNDWVKKGVILYFPIRKMATIEIGPLEFHDKMALKKNYAQLGVRVVPHAIARYGSYLAGGVIMMPSYVNIGAYVDSGTMVDTWATVGSCAQIGAQCHISAASQIGGVLEPVGALPVIVEDNVLVGGNCGVYEGTVVKQRAVLGTGTILNRSTPVYDLIRSEVYRATDEQPLVIPEAAVVVAGSRAIQHGPGKDWGISLYTPVIVKYRDAGTDVKVQLEDLLR